MSTTQRQRMSAESTEERAARLQQISTAQCGRLSAESAKEREATLLHVSATQLERRAAESSSLTREEQFNCPVEDKEISQAFRLSQLAKLSNTS